MQTRLVKTIILHPRYNRAVVDYDISIVELDEDINETSYVRPVCLPSKDQLVQPDTYCYITGAVLSSYPYPQALCWFDTCPTLKPHTFEPPLCREYTPPSMTAHPAFPEAPVSHHSSSLQV